MIQWVYGLLCVVGLALPYVVVTSLTGVSFGLPLFLLMRQRKIEQASVQAAG